MSRPVILESTATENAVNNLPFAIRSQLVYLANDSGTYDLKVNFDSSLDQSGSFTLKAGEVVDNVPMSCTSISYQAIGSGASVAFRLMGV